jgi:hypothetical protein
MADNEALDESATGASDDGGGGDPGDFSQSPPPAQQTAPQNGNTAPQAAPQPQNGAQAQPSPQTPAPAPNVTGKAAFMGNLLRTILSGVQNAPGNPNNTFARGFMQASPQAQQQRQVQQQKAQSEADIARTNASIAGLHLLQTRHMTDRMDQDDQEKFADMSDKYYKGLRDEGGMEIKAVGDPKAAKLEADRLNLSDPNVKGGLGTYQPLVHYDTDGKQVASVVFFGNKDVLKNDIDLGPNPGYDPDGPDDDEKNPERLVLKAGFPNKALPQAAQLARAAAQNITKNNHKEFASLLTTPKGEEESDNQLNALKEERDKNSHLYQANKDQVDSAIKVREANHQAALSRHAAERPPKEEKAGDMTIGTLNGKQVAGTIDELKEAGAKGITKSGAAEAEKIQNARSLTNVFDSKDPDDPGLMQLAAKLDGEGKLGPATTRFQQWLNQGNTAANFNAGDPDVQRLFTKMGLATTGLMQVHVGARGSAQMLEHFEDLAKAKEMSPSAFRTALDTENKYVRMKAMRPGDTTKDATAPKKTFDPSKLPDAS